MITQAVFTQAKSNQVNYLCKSKGHLEPYKETTIMAIFPKKLIT